MDKNKEITKGSEARRKIKAGIDRAAEAVAPTLGVVGMSAMIEFPGLEPIEADDGVTILKNLTFKDRYEQMGLQKLRKAALRTSSEGGDGTATTTVLTQSLVDQAFKEISNDSSKIREVRERLASGLKEIIAKLTETKREVKEEEIEKIALNSSLDPDISKIIAEIVKEVGVNGSIDVQKGQAIGYSKEVVPGAKFDKGLISHYFINNFADNTCVLENPYILLVDRKISVAVQIAKLMQSIADTKHKSILIIADDVDGTARASLIQNSKSVTVYDEATKVNTTGTYDIACVRNPYTATPGRDFLEDMAALTGATIISEEAGMKLDEATVLQCGRAQKVVVTKDSCMIIGGQKGEALEQRVKTLKDEIATTTSEYGRAMLKDRLAQLDGGIGVIRVGTYTADEFNTKKFKFDNAIAAVQAALAEGIVPGGGIALGKLKVTDRIFKDMLVAPFKQMAKNAGMDGWQAMTDLETTPSSHGIDFKTLQVVNMFEAGIIDPFKVVRLAVESAVAIASALVAVETAIVFQDEDESSN